MRVEVNCSGVRYAIIEASGNKDRPERLVIAYEDEDYLRDLIAAPSIFKLGFASRGEAMTNSRDLTPDEAFSKQASIRETHENGQFADRRSLVKHPSISHAILQSALAVLIAIFYSRNLVSVMIRMALGASF